MSAVFLPRPHLDDRRWDDLVESGRAMIPSVAPEWTDHNVSDPGITFLELFAAVTEAEIFQLDRVPESFRRTFLALVGIAPAPQRPSCTVLGFALPRGASPLRLPSGLECTGTDRAGQEVAFATLDPVTVVASAIVGGSARDGRGHTRDVTAALRDGVPFAPFGDDPVPGAGLTLELAAPLPVGTPVSLAVTTADDRDPRVRRAELDAVRARAARACRPPRSLVSCATGPEPAPPAAEPVHHSARVVWEARVGSGRWRRTSIAGDGTAALTLDGRVVLRVPEPMHRSDTEAGPRWSLRVRLAGGAFDIAPSLRAVTLNGVEAEQSVPVGELSWPVLPGADVPVAPVPGRAAPLSVGLDENGAVTVLHTGEGPELFVLRYAPPGATPGRLVVQAVGLAPGTGLPGQHRALPHAPVDARDVAVVSPAVGTGPGRRWALRPALLGSGRADAHAELDPATGRLRFGDGRRGITPAGPLLARYRSTRGAGGNVPAGTVTALRDSPRNAALLAAGPPTGDPRSVASARSAGLSVTQPVPAGSGADAETTAAAAQRARIAATHTERAVTTSDIEACAATTPGTAPARVVARANRHPGLPCVDASGVVTVLVVPHLPLRRPSPSPGLVRAVSARLDAHRVAGTRTVVVGPVYREVSVRAALATLPGAVRATLPERVSAALDAFLDPLAGGPDRTGWPFGRDVGRSEVFEVIGSVPGVDHVDTLEFAVDDVVTCGNVCIGEMELVVAGTHRVVLS